MLHSIFYEKKKTSTFPKQKDFCKSTDIVEYVFKKISVMSDFLEVS